MLSSILVATLAFSTALACPGLDFENSRSLHKRDDATPGRPEWSYKDANVWGTLDEQYGTCQNGTHQAPIALRSDQGLASTHRPNFQNYDTSITGKLGNWGYGAQLAFPAPENNDWSKLPSVTFEQDGANQTLYLREIHTHAPGEHVVDGQRAKAEMHLVHYDDKENPRAVFAVRVDSGNDDSEFFKSLPPMIGYKDKTTKVDATVNPIQLLQKIDNFSRYFTYSGSLTTPPCAEGIRFFLARDPLLISTEQMVNLLQGSQYSARPEQSVWEHGINR